MPEARVRNGGDVVVESLQALGADRVFGIPGQHALGLFDALHRSDLMFTSSRTENNAAFAADGSARVSGNPAVLLLSTGPGALTALAGLQEAHATNVPVVVVASQVPRAGLHGVRKGHLHQLDDQKASAANVTKSTHLVTRVSAIPSVLRDAWSLAVSSPQGPVWVEIPQDVLLEAASVPLVRDLQGPPSALPARAEVLEEAARLLNGAEQPIVVAGGGVRRARAEAELLAVAERCGAVVVCTSGGKGAFPWEHPLSAQSWVEEGATTEALEAADVLLVVGTSLGEVTSNYYALSPRGRVIQVDATVEVLESNHPALGVHADARSALGSLSTLLEQRDPARGQAVAAHIRSTVTEHLDAQDLAVERALLESIRAAVPDDADTFWDMTIAGYWAWSAWDPRSGDFHSAQGAGGIGWAYGAALGAATHGRRVLAVSGDGGAMYSVAELATAVQHQLPVTWLVIDDGGYGILREYMLDAFGEATATELSRPDFVSLSRAFGVPAEHVDLVGVRGAIDRAWEAEGPNVVVVEAMLRMFEPFTRVLPAG